MRMEADGFLIFEIFLLKLFDFFEAPVDNVRREFFIRGNMNSDDRFAGIFGRFRADFTLKLCFETTDSENQSV